jgi:hypothetical protein
VIDRGSLAELLERSPEMRRLWHGLDGTEEEKPEDLLA